MHNMSTYIAIYLVYRRDYLLEHEVHRVLPTGTTYYCTLYLVY